MIRVHEKTDIAPNPRALFMRAWEVIKALHKHSCIYFEDSTVGTKLDFKLTQRCDAMIEELREARRIYDERSKEFARMSVWSRRKTGVELEREILELRIEVCQLIEFCCDLLIENNSLMARSLMKPLKDEVTVQKLKAYGQKGIVEESINELYSPTQVVPEADTYDMSSRRLALVLCIFKERDGAVKDIRRLRSIFMQHKFQYNIEMNPTREVVFCAIGRFRASLIDRSTAVSCCVVVVMAHGKNGYITTSDGKDVKLQEIYDKFNNRQCPALRDKPKAFIIQACRGERHADEPSHDASSTCRNDAPIRKLPSTSDTLTVYTACPGKLANRHSKYGCRLTAEMESVFKEHACTDHMFELFTKVNRQMVCNEWSAEGWSAEGYEPDRVPAVPMALFHPRGQPIRAGKAMNEGKKKEPMHIQSNLTKKWYL